MYKHTRVLYMPTWHCRANINASFMTGGHVSLMQRRWQSGGNAFPPMKRGGGGAFWGDEHCQTTWKLWKLSEENTWVYEGKHLIKERQAATYNVPFNCRFLSK